MHEFNRTAVYIDRVSGISVYVTPAGVDVPPGTVLVMITDFPVDIRTEVDPGKVFFAKVNLNATIPSEVKIKDIEPAWGDTGPPGPLHFEA